MINAKRDYYQFNRVPEFWDWLIYQGQQGNIKIPLEVYEEFKDKQDSNGQKDDLAEWSELEEVRDSLLLQEESNPATVSHVLYTGYILEPTDTDLEKVGRDPFLISYAVGHTNPHQRCIVTAESSKPSRKGSNRHIPDVCNSFNILHYNLYQLIEALDFKTNWQATINR
ncbi:MAG: DUF4411 family protein [Porticoccus sp.]|nr:DUF4411 family protein [Porticoccus sp.]